MVGKENQIFMETVEMRPVLSHMPEFTTTDWHFCSASAAWRHNKIERFERPGSDGSFEYSDGVKDNSLRHDYASSQPFVIDFSPAKSYQFAPPSRMCELLSYSSCSQRRMPKELAAIREQSSIPIYLEQLPQRKCRMINSPSSS